MERMTEKVIRIEGIDPAELYGVAGSNIDRIGGKFPKLKMVARGSSIKVTGEAGEIERFDRKLSQLIEYYGRYGHVSPQVIDQVYDGGMPTGDGDLPEPQDVIVHGNAGLVVRARTVTQSPAAAEALRAERPAFRRRAGRLGQDVYGHRAGRPRAAQPGGQAYYSDAPGRRGRREAGLPAR